MTCPTVPPERRVPLSPCAGLAYSALALHPSVTHGSLLCSAVIFFYCSYLTFSAMSSEPQGYECNGRSSAQVRPCALTPLPALTRDL